MNSLLAALNRVDPDVDEDAETGYENSWPALTVYDLRFDFNSQLRLFRIPNSDYPFFSGRNIDDRPWKLCCGRYNDMSLPVLVNPNQTRLFRCDNSSGVAREFGSGATPRVYSVDATNFVVWDENQGNPRFLRFRLPAIEMRSGDLAEQIQLAVADSQSIYPRLPGGKC